MTRNQRRRAVRAMRVFNYTGLRVGDWVHADILQGEETDGAPAGLGPNVQLRGLGLVPMVCVYPQESLTEFCGSNDTCWAAEITEIGESAGENRIVTKMWS